MKRVAVALAAAVCALPACRTGERPAGAAYPVRIETVAGVKTFLNPAFPKEGVVRCALREELTLGGEAGGAESVLNRPFDLRVDARGDIYVLDWGDVEIKVFAPDGRLLRTCGKKGQGPGEFDIPVSFDLAADGRIFLLSGRQHMMIALDGAGKYLSSFRLDGFCDRLGVDRRNRIYYSQVLVPAEGAGQEYRLVQNWLALLRTDESGRETRRLGDYPGDTMLRRVQGAGAHAVSTSLSSRESCTTVWLVGPGDRIYIGYSRDYLLTVYDPDWKPLFRFGREFTPVRHPGYKANGPHPEFYPAFSDRRTFFDDLGNLWLEQYQEEGVADHAFDVFSPEGIYLKQVRLPEAPYLVRGDLAYAIIRQADEFLVVKRFRIVPAPPEG